MATAVPLNEVAGPSLKQRLARAERMNRLKSQALILPLLIFLLLTFLVPIGALLYKSVNNPEVVGSMPRTVEAISSWDGKALPAEPVYKALLKDMPTTPENIKDQVAMDVTFWADYGEQLEQRFNSWAAK